MLRAKPPSCSVSSRRSRLLGQGPRRRSTARQKVAEGPRRVWVKELAIHSAMDGQLEEAMTFVAAVANVMEVPAGTTVGKCSSALRLLSKSKEAAGTGYSRTTTTEERCLIATLGVGYADGYPRAASRKAQVRAAPFSPLHLS